MKDIAIYGAGGFGREVALMIRQINFKIQHWNLIGFYDDFLAEGSIIDGLPVIGAKHQVLAINRAMSLVIAIADPSARNRLITEINNQSIDFPVLVHPQANTGDEKRNQIGRGVIITAQVILTTGIKVGDFAILNLASTVGHDVSIGQCSTIMPGCSISGDVKIGKRCLLGTGSRILQGISIGDDGLVGAGAVVTRSFPENAKVKGVPAVPFNP